MLSSERILDSQLEEIQAIAPDAKVVITEDRDEIDSLVDDVEIATGWIPGGFLSRFTNLRWFQQWGAGADWLLKRPEFTEKDFILTNTSGLHAVPISEHILSLMLAFVRDLPRALLAKEQKIWIDHEAFDVIELAGKTMVLIGVGAIGKRTAEIAKAFGMRVLGVRRNPGKSEKCVEKMFEPSQLREVLPQADFLVLTIPLTNETRGIIGEQELKLLPKTAYIINIGRGGTIQEPYLIQALQEGWIAGAGLDVFENEPLAPDSPLWGLDKVILTPHYAGKTPHYAERAIEIFIQNLKRYQSAQPLINVVDKRLGY